MRNTLFTPKKEEKMYYQKVELCGVNTATLRVLTEEEKRCLLLRVREGDREA